MSLPALATPRPATGRDGTRRAARLMSALGPAASAVWAELSPAEADRLSAAMNAVPPEAPAPDGDADMSAFLSTFRQAPRHGDTAEADVWAEVSTLDPAAIARFIEHEHPQLVAVILSRLAPETSAQTVRLLPRPLASGALRRLMHIGRVRHDALAVIEAAMRELIESRNGQQAGDGLESVAHIFDRLDPRIEQGLMAELDENEPGSAARIRALMFTFDDLASLDPAAIQTILSSIDRADLAVALKGAKPAVRQVFLDNMTKRAGDLLVSEIEALGPVKRSEIEQARREITSIARGLARRGDILAADDADDELIE